VSRANEILELGVVDYIVLFDEINCCEIIDQIKPDVHCNGSDWGDGCVEREIVEKNGGRLHLLKWKPGLSTTKILEDSQHPGRKIETAVFLDRDGVINNDTGYVHTIKEFQFLPGVIDALKRLSGSDYKLFIITSQSGIGRGYYTERDFKKLNDWMLDDLKMNGVDIDRVYHCPHTPEDRCACRKPGIGMLEKAVEDFDVSLSGSWLVGDKDSDVLTGRRANVKTIKVGSKIAEKLPTKPHYRVRGLPEAVKIILGDQK